MNDSEEASVEVPVRCPRCGVEALHQFPEIVVVTALTRWNNMQLHVACHENAWSATPEELDRIRQHVGKKWLESRLEKYPQASGARRAGVTKLVLALQEN